MRRPEAVIHIANAHTRSREDIGITQSAVVACCCARPFRSRCIRAAGLLLLTATVIDLSVFTNHLFLRPRYQHYYFGDYYAANYQNAGFLPWFSFQSSRFGYDPIYAHQRRQYRQDPQWEQRVEATFRNRRDQEDSRPPRTWAAQRILGTRGVNLTERGFVMGEPLDQRVTSKDNSRRFQALDQESRQKLGAVPARGRGLSRGAAKDGI